MAVAAARQIENLGRANSGPTPTQVFREADAESIRNAEALAAAQGNFNAGEGATNALTQEQLTLQREVVAVRERAARAGALVASGGRAASASRRSSPTSTSR
jgi:hypothetical protein